MSSFYATISRYYDSEHYDKEEDLPFYSDIAPEEGCKVLVIGSGTGRLALYLAEAGHTVHGIEIEKAMLDRAIAKRDAIGMQTDGLYFHSGDALTYPLSETFNLAIIPYNTFMHFLDQESQMKLLKRLRKWLNNGGDGRLVIDLPNAGEAFGSQDTDSVILERTFLEQETGHLVMQQSVSRLDRAEQVMEVTWFYDEITDDGTLKRTIVPVTVRYFFAAEITLLLQAAGFQIEAIYGDFDQSPFEDGCPRMIVVAR
ncbi:MAG: class I SAM-dependent methyltransferase [Anaerolineae bacterium]|nr:class I SAM-dependent methyltransferase [Anaerolineae bacterium]